MKRCPECRRDYYDDSLFYCLDDGANLLEGPASLGGAQTAVLPAFGVVGEAGTLAFNSASAVPVGDQNSIAVLPFSNMSGDAGNDYFCDGISEELLNALTKIRGMRVAARTSAFFFKGKPTPIAEIGSALGVASVLDGSVRIAGIRLRISVQLADTKDGYQLWSETYDRTLDDIFAVQDDIAESVIQELRMRLVGISEEAKNPVRIESEVANAFKGRAEHPEAQRQLLLGRYFLDRTNREDGTKAIAYFQNAVALDPEFALGWAELAHAYCVAAGKNWMPVGEGYASARESVDTALMLEPALPEAHAQLGRIQSAYDLDLRAAAASYATALSLAPGNSMVADGASILELKLGNVDRALELCRGVLDQDPLSSAVWHNLGLICHTAGKLHEAERAFRKALELFPNRLVSNAMLAMVLLDGGRLQEALTQTFAEPDEFWRAWSQAIIYQVSGPTSEADATLEKLVENYVSGDAYQLAEIYAVRNEIDRAFDWLERALAERDPGITHANTSPHLRRLHGDPRWNDLMSELGLRPES